MALPGLSLPGLSSASSSSRPVNFATVPTDLGPPRTQSLPAFSELRFEVGFDKLYKIKLLSGFAEVFGTELATNVVNTFSGVKAAIFTWQGCSLELQGVAESEYVGSETAHMTEWLNLHGMLDTVREESGQDGGPRLLVLGTEASGKSSLVKCLTAWAMKVGRTPTVLNLDPCEGTIAIPSALTTTTYVSRMDVEFAGWGQSTVSGPVPILGHTPLTYHYPFSSPVDNPALYKSISTRIALAVTSKFEQDGDLKTSGMILDTPPTLNRPNDAYDIVHHLVSEFSINIIVTMGSERLYNDMLRQYPTSGYPETPYVLRVAPSPGAVARDEKFLKAHRAAQLKTYFFGNTRGTNGVALNPHSQTLPFSEVAIYRAVNPSATDLAVNFLPGQDDDDDDYNPAPAPGGSKLFEKVEPMPNLLNTVVAVKYASPSATQEEIRDAAVMGFVYVAEVDTGKKRIRFLAPHQDRWTDKVMVVGEWPASVGDLISS